MAQLELEAVTGINGVPPGSEDLAQGTDPVQWEFPIRTDAKGSSKKFQLSVSWDTLFSYIGPSMMNECTDEEMMEKVKLAYFHQFPEDAREFNALRDIILPYVFEDKIRVQLQALGLVAPGIKRRAVSDGGRYWRLTPYGEKHLIHIKAERKRHIE